MRATILACLCSTALCACNPAVKSTTPRIDPIAAIPVAEMTCPVSGEPVTMLDEAAFFESFPVFCKGRVNARQFASLEMKQRARLAAEQVLPQKGIANTTCPLTGEPLTANASAVAFEGTVVGFATPADAAQFRSLKPEKPSKLIADWKTESSAS